MFGIWRKADILANFRSKRKVIDRSIALDHPYPMDITKIQKRLDTLKSTQVEYQALYDKQIRIYRPMVGLTPAIVVDVRQASYWNLYGFTNYVIERAEEPSSDVEATYNLWKSVEPYPSM